MDVCVVGAGVVGLSSAVAVQDRLPNVRITIIAEMFGQNTTSYGSGGLIVPMAKGVPQDVGRQWCKDTVDHFYNIAFSSDASQAGVSLVSGFELTNKDKAPEYTKYIMNVNKLEPEVLKRFSPIYKNGYSATTAVVDLPIYLQWLSSKFLAKGGIFMKRKIQSLDELSGQFDVVVNCTGLGSQQLVGDPLLRPMRGQTLHLKAPWVKCYVHSDDNIHIFPFFLVMDHPMSNICDRFIPEDGLIYTKRQPLCTASSGKHGIRRGNLLAAYKSNEKKHVVIMSSMYHSSNSVFVGAVKQPGNSDMAISDIDGEDILTRNQAVFPPLKGAKVLWQWVGIRPERDSVRLEHETIPSKGKPLQVIHNYGHGSFGISLSWGCAVHVSKLVDNLHKQTISKL